MENIGYQISKNRPWDIYDNKHLFYVFSYFLLVIEFY